MTRKKNGFTLIEVVVTIALIGIIVPILYNFISFGGNIFSKGTTKADTQNDVNLIAYKITNDLRTASHISLTAVSGYTEYNVKASNPDLDQMSFTITKVGDVYTLSFTLADAEHQVTSEIALNNVKSAITGTSADVIWYMKSADASVIPQMTLGSASELYRKGDPTKTITFPIKTANIPNNAVLTAELIGVPLGVEIPSSPLVISNNATLGVKLYSNAESGVYPFKVTYEGAEDVFGEIHVLDAVSLYTVTFNQNGGTTAANPSSVEVQDGLSLGISMPTAPARTSYTFNGWNTASDGSGTSFDENTIVTGNLQVYALWAASGEPVVNNVKLTKIGTTTVDVSGGNTPRIKVKKGTTIKMVVVISGTNLDKSGLSVNVTNATGVNILSSSASTITLEYTLIADSGNKKDEDVTVNLLNGAVNINSTSFHFVTEN